MRREVAENSSCLQVGYKDYNLPNGYLTYLKERDR